jgi:prolyl oligopeptidase
MRAGIWIAAAVVAVAAAAKGANGVDDPYLWLEDVHGANPLAWVAEQNAHSTGILKADPDYQKDYDTILKIMDAPDRIPSPSLYRGTVRNFWQDATNPKGLWRRTTIASYESANPKWETLLDVDKLAADEKANWVFAGVTGSPSFKHALLFLSRGGTDARVTREFDPEKKLFLTGGFTLPAAKSDAAYRGDDTILFATDFGPGSMTKSGYPRIVKLWRRGTPVDSAVTVFEGTIDDVGASPFTLLDSDRKDYAFVVRNADFFNADYFYVSDDGHALQLPLPRTASVTGLSDGQLLFTLRKPWNDVPQGALAAFSFNEWLTTKNLPKLSVLYTPDARSSIAHVATGQSGLYVSTLENVNGRVYKFARRQGEWVRSSIALPSGGSADISSVNDYGPQTYFSFESYLVPSTVFADDGDGTLRAIKSLPARFDSSGMTTEQFEAVSTDGTKIPYFVTRKAGVAGPQPTVLYGYGGFEVSLTPSYSATFGKLWLEKGGVHVVANIRGGGEFGPGWHDAARAENRQKAFDDFAAVAADLIKRGITTPKQLGIMGGSNGGLLVSTVMTQHPELLGAVVCQVPLIDMIRYTGIGAGASWASEYGDPADAKAREGILKYSPYQNVKPGVKYPPVLFTTATSDDRVTPVHARKMAAKMEAMGDDVLFFENTDGGHGAAADHKQAAEMWTLSFIYLKQKLGFQ